MCIALLSYCYKSELGNILEQHEALKSKHSSEIREIEAYVEEIKTLADERESLTFEFEKENDILKSEIENGRRTIGLVWLRLSITNVSQSAFCCSSCMLLPV